MRGEVTRSFRQSIVHSKTFPLTVVFNLDNKYIMVSIACTLSTTTAVLPQHSKGGLQVTSRTATWSGPFLGVVSAHIYIYITHVYIYFLGGWKVLYCGDEVPFVLMLFPPKHVTSVQFRAVSILLVSFSNPSPRYPPLFLHTEPKKTEALDM